MRHNFVLYMLVQKTVMTFIRAARAIQRPRYAYPALLDGVNGSTEMDIVSYRYRVFS